MAFKLLELCSLSLGLAPKRLHAFFEEPTNFHRLNHYSPCSSPHLVLGVGEHKDMACLTIISQDDVGGLEVRRKSDGEWVKVKPIPGAYVVNVGNVMEAWTNGKYESVEHRVMVNSNKERVSTVFGFYPSHSVNVKPLEEFVDEKNCAKYKEYNWGLFLAAKKRKY